MTNLEIVQPDPTNPAALYRHFEDRIESQGCHLDLGLEDGQWTADYDVEIGEGIPESVHHGRRMWWTIPCLTAAGAAELLEDLAPLARRVLAGATVEWDGNNNVGRLDEDAQQADEEIARRCSSIDTEDYPQVRELEASLWYAEGDVPEVAADATDADLEQLAKAEARDAQYGESGGHPADHIVLARLDEWLRDAREQARAQLEAELVTVVEEFDAVEQRRNALIRRCKPWLSLRALGELAELSHTQIGRITAEAETG
jgi:hypothetical protein